MTSMETPRDPAPYDPAAEVVDLCRDLIRIDTTNFGDQPGPGERKAAELVATLLDEVGIESELWEAEPGRTNVVSPRSPARSGTAWSGAGVRST
jgi:acetylornithine deacetylase/succinyl-diaminopimelate desuccinylase-like protein